MLALTLRATSPRHPQCHPCTVVITKFIEGAQELDIDVVAHQGRLIVHAVSEHVEAAGVHSGDATLVLPPVSLPKSDLARCKAIAEKVAKALKISRPFNMQIIWQQTAAMVRDPDGKEVAEAEAEAKLKVIECNLRASQSFLFVSKVLGHNFIETATAAILGTGAPEPMDLMAVEPDYLLTTLR